MFERFSGKTLEIIDTSIKLARQQKDLNFFVLEPSDILLGFSLDEEFEPLLKTYNLTQERLITSLSYKIRDSNKFNSLVPLEVPFSEPVKKLLNIIYLEAKATSTFVTPECLLLRLLEQEEQLIETLVNKEKLSLLKQILKKRKTDENIPFENWIFLELFEIFPERFSKWFSLILLVLLPLIVLLIIVNIVYLLLN